jgi:hypothetical protein
MNPYEGPNSSRLAPPDSASATLYTYALERSALEPTVEVELAFVSAAGCHFISGVAAQCRTTGRCLRYKVENQIKFM